MKHSRSENSVGGLVAPSLAVGLNWCRVGCMWFSRWYRYPALATEWNPEKKLVWTVSELCLEASERHIEKETNRKVSVNERIPGNNELSLTFLLYLNSLQFLPSWQDTAESLHLLPDGNPWIHHELILLIFYFYPCLRQYLCWIYGICYSCSNSTSEKAH